MPALIEAAEKGKQSVCIVELRARFDERQNIEWSRALERVGVHVVYGFPTKKVHAKATLIVRREGDVLRRYVHVGTGNYHSVTAEIYEDFGLFTADPDIVADVADLFNYVTGFGKPQRFRKLLVAPFDLREQLIAHIRRVASAAEAGEKAKITMKVNSLTDEAIIGELYAASRGGSADHPHRARHLLPAAGRQGHVREHRGAERPRPLPRAQPDLQLRDEGELGLAARQRRPHAA